MSKKRTDRLIGLAVDIRDDLEHICERADGVYDIRETLHSIDSAGGTNTAQNLAILNLLRELLDPERGDIPKRATPGDYGTPECPRVPNGGTPNTGPTANALDANTPRRPRVAADVPQEATIPAASDARTGDPGTGEGGAAKPPQNAACEWPTERGLYWISGESDDGPCQGVASLTQTAPGARELTLIDGTGATTDAIWEIAQDRLYACVPLTCVPTALLDNLYDASPDSYGRANEAIHDIEQWTVDHDTITGGDK